MHAHDGWPGSAAHLDPLPTTQRIRANIAARGSALKGTALQACPLHPPSPRPPTVTAPRLTNRRLHTHLPLPPVLLPCISTLLALRPRHRSTRWWAVEGDRPGLPSVPTLEWLGAVWALCPVPLRRRLAYRMAGQGALLYIYFFIYRFNLKKIMF